MAPATFRQRPQAQTGDGHPLQIENRMAQQVRNPADLTVASLQQNHLEQCAIGATLQHANLGRSGACAVQRHTPSPALQGGVQRRPLHPDPIGLGMVKAGVGQPQRQLTLVRQQEGASAVGIQTSNRVESLAQRPRQQIQNRGPPAGVTAGADHARWLVDQQHGGLPTGRQRPAINLDDLAVRVRLIAKG